MLRSPAKSGLEQHPLDQPVFLDLTEGLTMPLSSAFERLALETRREVVSRDSVLLGDRPDGISLADLEESGSQLQFIHNNRYQTKEQNVTIRMV